MREEIILQSRYVYWAQMKIIFNLLSANYQISDILFQIIWDYHFRNVLIWCCSAHVKQLAETKSRDKVDWRWFQWDIIEHAYGSRKLQIAQNFAIYGSFG